MDSEGTQATTILEMTTLIDLYFLGKRKEAMNKSQIVIAMGYHKYYSAINPIFEVLIYFGFLVSKRKEGHMTFYSIDSEKIKEFILKQIITQKAYFFVWDQVEHLEPELYERSIIDSYKSKYSLKEWKDMFKPKAGQKPDRITS